MESGKKQNKGRDNGEEDIFALSVLAFALICAQITCTLCAHFTVSHADARKGRKKDAQRNRHGLTMSRTQFVSEAGSIGLPEDTPSVFIAEILVD